MDETGIHRILHSRISTFAMTVKILTQLPPELLIQVAKALGTNAASISAFSQVCQVCRQIHGLISRFLRVSVVEWLLEHGLGLVRKRL